MYGRVIFVTRLPKGVVSTPPYIFAIKPPILMILKLENRYGPFLSTDTKKTISSPLYYV